MVKGRWATGQSTVQACAGSCSWIRQGRSAGDAHGDGTRPAGEQVSAWGCGRVREGTTVFNAHIAEGKRGGICAEGEGGQGRQHHLMR